MTTTTKHTLLINRIYDNSKQTLGNFELLELGFVKLRGFSLEPPWKENKRNESCIPEGTYEAVLYDSPSKGIVYLLKDVPDRSMIEIHKGNFNKDSTGCILVGSGFQYIDDDSEIDVSGSTATLNKIFEITKGEDLTIIIK